jgi:hypothetical protein
VLAGESIPRHLPHELAVKRQIDGATLGEGATVAWFGDVPQPAKTETTRAATRDSRLPNRFRKVYIALS